VTGKDSSGNIIAQNTAVASIPPTTVAGAATGSLDNNGFDDPGVIANYDFTFNFVNRIPSGG